ncbi:MAG: TldD/PmbA family protein [bacterium]
MKNKWKETIAALSGNNSRVDGEQVIYYEDREKLEITLQEKIIDEINCSRDRGVGISGIDREKTEHYCFSTPAELQKEFNPGPAGEFELKSKNKVGMEIKKQPDFQPSAEKIEKLREADRSARQVDEKINRVKINYRERKRDLTIYLPGNNPVNEERIYTSLRVTAVGVAEGRRERGFASAAGYCGQELLAENPPEELARKAAERALISLEARPVKAGTNTVVIAPGFGGTIFHEACGHGFEADHIYEDASVYRGKMGEEVASELVNFVDDGSINNLNGSFAVDDEGEKSRRNFLIKDGIMEGMMADKKYGSLLGVGSTGNGRRESFREPALPRMSNTYIESGSADPGDIIESTGDGIYAAHIGGGQVDPASGDFIFSADEAYRIENGKITAPVRDVALVGNGPEILHRVDAVGSDLEFAPGSCGKGQWVPVSVGQPTLRVRDLRVGGKS